MKIAARRGMSHTFMPAILAGMWTPEDGVTYTNPEEVESWGSLLGRLFRQGVFIKLQAAPRLKTGSGNKKNLVQRVKL